MLRKILIIALLFSTSCNNRTKKYPEADQGKDIRKRFKDTADALYQSKRYAEAIKYWDKLVLLSPDSGEYFYKRGRSHDEISHRPDTSAIRDYLESAKRGYQQENCYFDIGLNYLFFNDSLALIYFGKSLDINPNDQDALFWLKECKKRISESKGLTTMPSQHL